MNIKHYLSFILTYVTLFYNIFCNNTNESIKTNITNNTNNKFILINKSNLNSTIEDSNSLLLLFIKLDNDCLQCEDSIKILNNVYNAIPKDFPHSINFAILNVTEYPDVAQQYHIYSFPTLYFIRFGYNIFNYLDFEINESSLLEFINKKLVKKWIEIESLEHFSKIKSNSKLMLFYCGNLTDINSNYINDSDSNSNSNNNRTMTHFDILNNQINQYDEMTLTWSINYDLLKALNCSTNNIATDLNNKSTNNSTNSSNNINANSLFVLFKNFDDGEESVYFEGSITNNKVEEFLAMYASPIILDLTNENIKVTINQSVPTIIVFLNKKEINKHNYLMVERMYKTINTQAKKYRVRLFY